MVLVIEVMIVVVAIALLYCGFVGLARSLLRGVYVEGLHLQDVQ